MLARARDRVASLRDTTIADFARRRAAVLAEDHARIRAAGINVPRVSVEAVLPADVVGLFALLPAGL